MPLGVGGLPLHVGLHAMLAHLHAGEAVCGFRRPWQTLRLQQGETGAQSRKTPGGHPVAMQSQRWAAQVSTTGSAGAPAALFDRPPVQSSRDPGRPEHQGLLVGESSSDLGLTRAAGDPGWTRAAGTPCCQ